MEGHKFNFFFSDTSGVQEDAVVNGFRRGACRIIVRDHEEVKEILTIVRDDTLIEERTRIWISNSTVVCFLKHSDINVFINRNHQQFRIISRRKTLNLIN